MKPNTQEAYDLFHRGVQALARVEANGMRVDTDYLQQAIVKTERRAAHMERGLATSEVMKAWRKRFGAKTNLQSTVQLGTVLFEVMGFESTAQTATGRAKTDDEALETVDDPFVQTYLHIKRLRKAVATNLKGLLRETVDGYVHPFFNLHTVTTYRSSSDSPNFQNVPKHDPEIKQLVRRAFVARPGRQIVEEDFKGIEVGVATCYHHDPKMLDYLNDKTKDMHRDMAMECFLLPREEVTEQIRFQGKGGFVFPQFYGDWYIDCARSLWGAIRKMNLVTTSGVPLAKHLRAQGIRELGALNPKQEPREGTFEAHIKKVERRFWEKRFPVYAQWKRDWYDDYKKKGWFGTLTGFVCKGYMKKNEVINYPVQGSAFHCLLWALSRIVLEELDRRKMKTLIVGQIHDSIVADVPEAEVEDYIHLCRRVMLKLLRRAWPWIIVPLDIEAEVAPVDGSWVDKVKREMDK